VRDDCVCSRSAMQSARDTARSSAVVPLETPVHPPSLGIVPYKFTLSLSRSLAQCRKRPTTVLWVWRWLDADSHFGICLYGCFVRWACVSARACERVCICFFVCVCVCVCVCARARARVCVCARAYVCECALACLVRVSPRKRGESDHL